MTDKKKGYDGFIEAARASSKAKNEATEEILAGAPEEDDPFTSLIRGKDDISDRQAAEAILDIAKDMVGVEDVTKDFIKGLIVSTLILNQQRHVMDAVETLGIAKLKPSNAIEACIAALAGIVVGCDEILNGEGDTPQDPKEVVDSSGTGNYL
jgi:hypothetical protein